MLGTRPDAVIMLSQSGHRENVSSGKVKIAKHRPTIKRSFAWICQDGLS
jgi:hypothetical protein